MANYSNPYLNPYYGYQQPYVPQNPPAVQSAAPATNGLIWVQGETGAKSYVVPAGGTVLLMDSEARKFYIKSVDASGIPMPLRTFEYDEVLNVAAEEAPKSDYVTREEFEKKIAELMTTRKGTKKDE